MNKLEDLLDNFWNTHKNNAGVAYVPKSSRFT